MKPKTVKPKEIVGDVISVEDFITKKKTKKKKTIPGSRRYSLERPDNKKQCRGNAVLNENHPCKKTGHAFQFAIRDRYGYCPRCGDETLS